MSEKEFIIRPFLVRDSADVGVILFPNIFNYKILCGSKCYVACFLDMPIGVVYCKVVRKSIHITHIAVREDFQGMGAGQDLLNFCLAKGSCFDCKTAVASVPLDSKHIKAHNFFKKTLGNFTYKNDPQYGERLIFMGTVPKGELSGRLTD